jgi:hypothetical protein
MLRLTLRLVLVAFAVACLAQDVQAKERCCGKVVDYLFGGYCGGPFGYGNCRYEGWIGYPNGCVDFAGTRVAAYPIYSSSDYPVSTTDSVRSTTVAARKTSRPRK